VDYSDSFDDDQVKLRVMTMAVGYFDESADGTQSVCYTVAGFIGSNEATAILELRWRDILNKYNLKYFKASEPGTTRDEVEAEARREHICDPTTACAPERGGAELCVSVPQ
jgi:hypothetical protein